MRLGPSFAPTLPASQKGTSGRLIEPKAKSVKVFCLAACFSYCFPFCRNLMACCVLGVSRSREPLSSRLALTLPQKADKLEIELWTKRFPLFRCRTQSESATDETQIERRLTLSA